VPPAAEPPRTRRDRAVVLGAGLAGVLCATPGVHLAELWLPRLPAVLVSHGVAVVLLGVAVRRWRAARLTGRRAA
jgi:putative Ca2+/H+ antiporter (TMEM165/GDT1 family)